MEIIKKFGPGAVLSVAGMKAAELAGFTGVKALLAAIGGAFAGLFIASKV